MIITQGQGGPRNRNPKPKPKPRKAPNLYAALSKVEAAGGQVGPKAGGPAKSAFRDFGPKPGASQPKRRPPRGTMPGAELHTPAAKAYRKREAGRSQGLFKDVAKGALGTGRVIDSLIGVEDALHGNPLSLMMLLGPGKIGKLGKFVLRRNKPGELVRTHADTLWPTPKLDDYINYSLYDTAEYIGQKGPLRVPSDVLEKLARGHQLSPLHFLPHASGGAKPVGSMMGEAVDYMDQLFVTSLKMDPTHHGNPAVRHLLEAAMDEAKRAGGMIDANVQNKDLKQFLFELAHRGALEKKGLRLSGNLEDQFRLWNEAGRPAMSARGGRVAIGGGLFRRTHPDGRVTYENRYGEPRHPPGGGEFM